MEQQALQGALDYLGAAELEPGYYVYRLAFNSGGVGSGRYRVATEDGLKPLVEALAANPSYSVHRRAINTVMPEWWSPEDREAWQHLGGGCTKSILFSNRPLTEWRRVTASLDTGEVVPLVVADLCVECKEPEDNEYHDGALEVAAATAPESSVADLMRFHRFRTASPSRPRL